jgi:hypothetical protein
MLLGKNCGSTGNELAANDTARALHFLQHHIGFVGLTTRWDESVCAWRQIVGGPIEGDESPDLFLNDYTEEVFEHPRKAPNGKCAQFVIDALKRKHFLDESDEAVFAGASAKFEEQLEAA